MLVLIFCSIIYFSTGTLINEIGKCGYPIKMYNLNSGDMMKVQSPQFPKSLTSSQTSANVSCSMTFKRTDQKNNGLQFIFTNGHTAGFLFNTPNGLMNVKKIGKQNHADDPSTYNFYDSNWNIQLLNAKNEQSLTYSYGMNSGGLEWSAFEAFVYAPEDNEQSNSCWMNGKKIDLVDDSKTIPLFFEQNPSNLQNCSWTINVPDDMAMKMTIPKYQLPGLNSQIRVYPNGGDFISLGEGISQIFNGKYFVIELLTSGAFMKFEDDFLAFYALVSAVYKIPPVTTEFQCTKTTNFDKTDTIKFFDPQNGYPNSGICKMPLSSAPKTALIFEPQSRYMEYLGEQLQIHDSKDMILGDIMASSVYSGENVDNWNLQFVTDENINGAGFSIRTFPIDCECAPNEFMVNCREQRFIPIMTGDTSSLTQTYTYCRGMNCSYKILPNNDCIDKNVEIDIKWKSFPDKYFDDSVVLNIDGNEVWNNTVSNVFSGTFDQGNLIEITLESEAYEFGFFSQPPTLVVAVTIADTTSMTNPTTPAMTTIPVTTMKPMSTMPVTTMPPMTTKTIPTIPPMTTMTSRTSPPITTMPVTTMPPMTTKTSTAVPSMTTMTSTTMRLMTSSLAATPMVSASSAAPSPSVQPNVYQITLTAASPVVSIQLNNVKVSTQWTVMAPSHQTLDLFISLDENNATILHDYMLTDGTDPSFKLSDVPKMSDPKMPRIYTSKHKILTIFGKIPGAVTLFFRIREIHAINCMNYTNIIQSNPGNQIDLSFQGSNSGNCLTTILAYTEAVPLVSLQKLSTTGDAAVLVVAGIDPNFVYLRFYKNTAADWNSVVLAGSYNSVIVPPKATVKSECKVTNSKIESVPKITAAQGIVYSLNYVMPNYSYNSQTPVTVASLEGRQSATTIACQFLDLAKDDFVQIIQGGTTTAVTKVGQTIQFNESGDINFVYKNTDVTKRGFLFEFKESPDMSSANFIGFSFILMFFKIILF